MSTGGVIAVFSLDDDYVERYQLQQYHLYVYIFYCRPLEFIGVATLALLP